MCVLSFACGGLRRSMSVSVLLQFRLLPLIADRLSASTKSNPGRMLRIAKAIARMAALARTGVLRLRSRFAMAFAGPVLLPVAESLRRNIRNASVVVPPKGVPSNGRIRAVGSATVGHVRGNCLQISCLQEQVKSLLLVGRRQVEQTRPMCGVEPNRGAQSCRRRLFHITTPMPRESNLGNARCLSGSGQAFAVSGLDKRVQHRCLLRAETLVIIVSPRPKTCLCVCALILRMRWIRRCWFAMLVLRRRVQSYAPSVGCESGKISVFVVKCARRRYNVLKDDFAKAATRTVCFRLPNRVGLAISVLSQATTWSCVLAPTQQIAEDVLQFAPTALL